MNYRHLAATPEIGEKFKLPQIIVAYLIDIVEHLTIRSLTLMAVMLPVGFT